MSSRQHLTTRRAFITTVGFGGVALYGAWAAYGAAPLPFIHRPGRDANAHPPQADAAPPHPGHSGGGGGMTPEEFIRRHEEFLARFQQPDGSVVVAPPASSPAAHTVSPATAAAHPTHASPHDSAASDAREAVHGGHESPSGTGSERHNAPAGRSDTDPVDVFLHAYRFGFAPDELRIQANERYRFRMMASDITHGASLQLGHAAHVIRLRTNVVSDRVIVFSRPGPILVYCTVSCGPAHDAMKARIIVT